MTATFTKAGNYTLLATIKDAGNLTVTSAVPVTVNQTLTTVAVTPASARVNPSATQTYAATGSDQFGVALTVQPTWAWTATGGTITSGGIYTAGTTTGPFAVTATSGGKSGSTPVIINAAPTVATAASASPSPVTGTTAALAVVGGDDAGEPALTYAWATTSVPSGGAATFSATGTNAAKNVTATFTKAGPYTVQATIKDSGNRTVTSSVSVTVNQTLTTVVVTPASARVNPSATQAYAATGSDQFGVALTVQPTWAWTATGGTITSAGAYTAGTTTGPFAVTATSGGKSGSTPVIINAAPTVATAASANPSPVTGTTAALAVVGGDDAGEPALTYAWAATSVPSGGAATFSATGTNAAKNVTATFTKAGPYTVQATIKDSGNRTVTSAVSVTVNQTLTSIAVTPTPVTVNLGATQTFTATGKDQFAVALSAQPTFTWTTSGGGTVTSAGVFTAATVGGPFTVTAASGGKTGTAQVTVVTPPTVATAASATPAGGLITSTVLGVLGSDAGGEAGLTYTWSSVGTPPASSAFSPNGTNAAKQSTATLNRVGDYRFQVTIRNAAGGTATSVVDIRVDGLAATAAGNGTGGYGSEGGLAIAQPLYSPNAVAADAAGNLFIAEMDNERVRRVDAVTGVLTTVAGTGGNGFGADNQAATLSALSNPAGVALDGAGNIYISEFGAHRVRKVASGTGTITTIAGQAGSPGFSGDGGAGTSARLTNAASVAVDSAANVFIADYGNNRVRRVDHATGVITTLAGNGTAGDTGDGGLGTAASLNGPNGIAVDAAGNVYVCEYSGNRVRKITVATGIITTVAGGGSGGDGGLATAASLNGPNGVGIDAQGGLYIAEYNVNRVRRVLAASGIIATVMGTGSQSYSGDGGPAQAATVNGPGSMCFLPSGAMALADRANQRVRLVTSAPVLTTVVSATPANVTTTTTMLSVQANDNAGEPALIYTWSSYGTPPAAVTFSPNGTNAAKTSTATFTQPGTYQFLVTVKDAANQTATSVATAVVVSSPSSMTVSPATASLTLNASRTFTVAASNDQFGHVTSTSGTTWTVSGGGTITAAGVFTAGGTPTANVIVTAALGAASNTATVQVVNATPTIATAPSATPNPTATQTAVLTILGADDGGEPQLLYGWSVTSGPTGAYFSPNFSNGAKNTTIHVPAVGTYSIQATITDAFGAVVAATPLTLTVTPTFTGLGVLPATMVANPGSSRTFTAQKLDQFGAVMTGTPTVTWSTSGGGTIAATGVLTAAATPGGPYTVTATSGTITGTAALTVQSQRPTAISQSLSTTVGTALPFTLTANDPNLDPLTYRIVTGPAHGTLSGALPNQTFTPTAGYSGSDALTFVANDGGGDSNVATIAINVLGQVAPQNTSASPLVRPAAFDAYRWTNDASYRSSYLATCEPGRVWLTAAGAAGVPNLQASGPRTLLIPGGTVGHLAVIGAPNAAVTFTSLGDGFFTANAQNTLTVQADGSGLAGADYRTPNGGRVPILVGSPGAVGQVRFLLQVALEPYLVLGFYP